MVCCYLFIHTISGTDPGFQVRGGRTLKNCAERREARKFWGISCEKSPFYAKKKSYLFQFQGGARRVRPLDPPLTQELQVEESSSYPLHPAFNEKSKKSTLYSLTSINCVVSQGSCGLQKSYRRTDGRTDGHQVFEQRA